MTVSNSRTLSVPLAALLVASAIYLTATPPAFAQKQDGAGVVLSAEASAKDVGLPLYPGSKRHKDKDDDSAGANLGLWGGGSGFKMFVLKMEPADSPDKVADFYKKALAKYGTVLDCSNNASPKKADAGKDDKALSCGNDKPDGNGKLLKAGSKEQQHMVGIEPSGSGTLYQIVYLSVWTDDKKK